jgi:hypothetical protein
MNMNFDYAVAGTFVPSAYRQDIRIPEPLSGFPGYHRTACSFEQWQGDVLPLDYHRTNGLGQILDFLLLSNWRPTPF